MGAQAKTLFYTFRTFPDALIRGSELEGVFRFGKLRKDLKTFESYAQEENPTLIVGFALSHKSRQETIAINKFSSGQIEKSGPARQELINLSNSPFPLAKTPTHSFCNWTMYKLARNYEVSFFHIEEVDFDIFLKWAERLLN